MILSSLVLGLFAGMVLTENAPTKAAARSTVTLYLHGHHGGERSMDDLIRSAETDNDAHSVITAIVRRDGTVRLKGAWPKKTVRPLVKVVFRNNRTMRYHRISNWLRNVLEALQSRYGISKFNIVAHSLGNAAVLFYELRYGHDAYLSQLRKYVAIAGNFDGIPGKHRDQHRNRIMSDGRPEWFAPKFKDAMRLRNNFPKKQVKVLNIYGNLGGGMHSDGKVLNASSRSLGFLLRRRAKSYREIKIDGWDAQHSVLRTNPQVALDVNEFLF